MKLGATEGRETTKEEQPDFFSLAQTKEMSPKEKRKQFFTFVMNLDFYSANLNVHDMIKCSFTSRVL